MNKSEHINELAAALAAAQAAMKGAVRDSQNPFFRSAYADLQSVWEACREPLAKNGLCVIQTAANDGEKIAVETILAHKSGQWVSSSLSAAPAKSDAQGIGSLVSYLRRYALAAMVGVYQCDDDGEAAVGRPPQTRQARQEAAAKRADEAEIITMPAETGKEQQEPQQEPQKASRRMSLAQLWARAQRIGKDEAWWREALHTCGITKEKSTHTQASMAMLADLLDQSEGINADVD